MVVRGDDDPLEDPTQHSEDNLTDKTAKHSSDSTASSHKVHRGQEQEQTKATIQDHNATPGPAQSSDIGEAKSKQEMQTRASELNKESSS